MTKSELIEKLEKLTELADSAGMSDHDIVDALQNVAAAIKAYPKSAKKKG